MGIPLKEGLRLKKDLRSISYRRAREGISLKEGLRRFVYNRLKIVIQPRTGIPLEEGLRPEIQKLLVEHVI